MSTRKPDMFKIFGILIFSMLLMSACVRDGMEPDFEPVTWIDGAPTGGRFNKITETPDGRLIAIGGERWRQGYMYISDDGGLSWKAVASVNDTSDFFLTGIHILEDGKGICVGFGGQKFFTEDFGQNWIFHRDDSWAAFQSVFICDNQEIRIPAGGSFQTGILAESALDQWWMLTQDSILLNAMDIIQLDNGDWLAAGLGGVIRQKVSQPWERSIPDSDFFVRFAKPSPSVVYVCGFNGSLYKLHIPEDNWQQLLTPSPPLAKVTSWNTVHFFDEKHGSLAGEGGVIWHTTDGGLNWKKWQMPDKGDLYSVFMLSQYSCLAGGRDGKLHKITFE
jgi:photosystem II stability/assembly factor-like uncharacterized protein